MNVLQKIGTNNRDFLPTEHLLLVTREVYQQGLRARVKCNDVVGKCCKEPTHIENFNSAEYSYEDELLEFQDQHRRLLKMWGMAAGLAEKPHEQQWWPTVEEF
jgi:hypothetical protein